MASIFRASKAEEDLLHIWLYVAQHDPDAADKLLDQFGEVFERIASSPGLGRDRSEAMAIRNLRSFPIQNYMIFYQEQTDGDIMVLRVFHTARDIENLFEG